jgi:hypothetical protein
MSGIMATDELRATERAPMKVLTIGFSDPNIVKPGEEWEQAWDFYLWTTLSTELRAQTQSGIYDYDLFIVDAESLAEDDGDIEQTIHEEIDARVRCGGVLICFAACETMEWMPGDFRSYSTGGSKVSVIPKTPFANVLTRYRSRTQYRTLLELSDPWEVLEVNNANAPIAAWRRYGEGCILLLPWFVEPGKVVRSVLDTVLPKLAPQLFQEEERIPEQAGPQWLAAFPVPGITEIAAEIEKVEREIENLQDMIEQKKRVLHERENERREREELQWLLWGTGKRLERVVMRALAELRIEAYPQDPVDLVVDLEDGKLFIEVEGSEGPINVEKGRQLLGYIHNTDEPEKVDGAILGNPFRLVPPDSRPPEGSQTGLFTTELEKMAKKHSWHLVETRDLFRLVTAYLQTGDQAAHEEIRNLLGI